MADVKMMEAIGAGLQTVTNIAGLGQAAHENAVAYQEGATVGADARAQNQRLLQGPGAFPGYTQNVQGYGHAGPTGQYATIEPQFTDGAPPPEMVQQAAQQVMQQPAYAIPKQYVPTNRAAPQEQIMGAFGMDPRAAGNYYPEDAARGAEALGLIFSQLVGGARAPYSQPVWFDDGTPQQVAPVTRQGRRG